MSHRVRVLHNKKTHEVGIDPDGGLELLCYQLYSLTTVPPESQKIIFKGKVIKLDEDLAHIIGQTVTLIGAPEETRTSIAPSKAPTRAVPNAEQVSQLALMSALQDLQSCCTRVFFGEKRFMQPSLMVEGHAVCRCCATTCKSHMLNGGAVSPADDPLGFTCQCSEFGECLFVSRLSGLDLVSGPLEESLIKQLEHISSLELAEVKKAKESEMTNRIMSGSQTVLQYEDPALQSKARACVPLDVLEQRTRDALSADASLDYMDERLRQLMHWYKREFMSWVGDLVCERCQGPTERRGASAATPQERRGLASHAEIFYCTVCQISTRFPRFNHAGAILESKRGRCGEWAQAFTLFCRAMGYDARYVLDWTDHVWTEIYSEHLGRYVHCDPCEDSWDSPLLYEQGWGKKLTFVVGFSRDDIRDVTRRYTRTLAEVLERRARICPEAVFQNVVQTLSATRQLGLAPERQTIVTARAASEEEELIHAGRPPETRELETRHSGNT
mmetsp:Transcript_35376/g.57241  ORF Transcript_35376/g.57241 Transcript_35376/m.57241 type:complete len:500 (+) Transcript_35376:83-1582(+)